MSSQSSSDVYDDPVECFDKLEPNESLNCTNQTGDEQANDDKQNDPNLSELDREGYLEDYFKTENQHRLQSKWTIWYSKL